MQNDLEQEVRRLGIDFEKSTPWAEWEFVDVRFASANVDVTVRHKIRSPGTIAVIPVSWRFIAAPSSPPAIYTILGTEPQQPGYIKLRSTVAGYATVLLGLRRDS